MIAACGVLAVCGLSVRVPCVEARHTIGAGRARGAAAGGGGGVAKQVHFGRVIFEVHLRT
eukprot:COSAG01_NODE_9613_length_2389_cov_4.000000_6_plen_60_part_00